MDGHRSEHVGKLSWRMTALNRCTVTEIIIIIQRCLRIYLYQVHGLTINYYYYYYFFCPRYSDPEGA